MGCLTFNRGGFQLPLFHLRVADSIKLNGLSCEEAQSRPALPLPSESTVQESVEVSECSFLNEGFLSVTDHSPNCQDGSALDYVLP